MTVAHGLHFDTIIILVEGKREKGSAGKFIRGDSGGGEASGSDEEYDVGQEEGGRADVVAAVAVLDRTNQEK